MTRNNSRLQQKEVVVLTTRISETKQKVGEIQVMAMKRETAMGQIINHWQTERTLDPGVHNKWTSMSLESKQIPKSNTINFRQCFKHSHAS